MRPKDVFWYTRKDIEVMKLTEALKIAVRKGPINK
jgi:hypothetical protein